MLNRKALVDKVPIFGICLGMQLLTFRATKGPIPGLGWIAARTLAFKGQHRHTRATRFHTWDGTRRKTHSQPAYRRFRVLEEHPLLLRSLLLMCSCDDEQNSILKTTYGLTFDSAIQKDNIFGAQFHPEKSHEFGMKLFENFARL